MTSTTFNSILSCVAYSFCSISMVLANKIVVGHDFYDFGHPTLTIVIQNAIAVFLLEAAKATGYITYEQFNIATAKKWTPVNLNFIAMLETSVLSMKFLPIHMITVFKNVTNLGITWGDWYYFGQAVSAGILGSLGIMLFGAVMGALTDLQFSFVGYFWMVLNCASTAAYVLYMRNVTSGGAVKLSRFGMVYYNNLISIPLCLFLALCLGEVFTVWSYKYLFDFQFWVATTFSGVVGVALNLASYWCVGATSATTYATVGAVNKIPGIIIGYLFMNQQMDSRTGLYVSTGMLGAMLYSYVKFKEAEQEKAKKAGGGSRGSVYSSKDKLKDDEEKRGMLSNKV